MRWLKKHSRNFGIASISMLFFLTCLALIPSSVASAHEGPSKVAVSTTVAVQATPTEDAMVTALNKEKLAQEVNQLKNQNFWSPWTNFATPLSILVALVAASFGFWRWRVDRRDTQDRELKDRQNEQEKRAEERFQAAVAGLGDEKEEARIGAAILLRTFLRPGYERFYTQIFDLVVAHLQPLKTSREAKDPMALPFIPVTILRRALIVVFKEVFSLARNKLKEENPQFSPQSLNASRIQLDKAHLSKVDLKQAWMPQALLRYADLEDADLREANLWGANLRGAILASADLSDAKFWGAYPWLFPLKADLSEANFYKANLSGADLREADLSKAYLWGANLRRANLYEVNLSEAYLREADLSGADLHNANLSRAGLDRANFTGADLTGADLTQTDPSIVNLSLTNLSEAKSLWNTDLRGARDLTKEQLAACKAKGAIIDEDPMTNPSQSTVAAASPPQSTHAQASLASPDQESTPPSDLAGSNTASSQQKLES